MKIRKIGLLLIVLQLILCFSLVVSASSNGVTFAAEADASVVKAGDTVDVDVSLTENAGFLCASFDVAYDKTALQYVGYSLDNSAISTNKELIRVDMLREGNLVIYVDDLYKAIANVGNPDKAYDQVGLVATLTFKALDKEGATKVSVNAIKENVPDINFNTNYDVVGAEATINVLGSNHVSPAIKSAALELRDNLAVNFKVVPQAGYANYAVKFVFNGEETVVTEYTVEEGTGRYVFPFTNIAPNQMADTITATLTTTFAGEEVVCNTVNYSAATYCYNQLGKDVSADLKTLLVDLLNYGAAAQTYTKYNTEALVNADLTDEQKSWATAETPAVENKQNTAHKVVENAVATWKGAGLNLTETVCIRLKFAAESIEGLSVKIATDSNSWTIPASEFEAAGNGAYYVYFSGLNAGQMREVIYATVYSGETAVSNTLAYSIETYAAKNLDSAAGDLLAAMIKYGDAAAAYAN